jgi:hypothetical protein
MHSRKVSSCVSPIIPFGLARLFIRPSGLTHVCVFGIFAFLESRVSQLVVSHEISAARTARTSSQGRFPVYTSLLAWRAQARIGFPDSTQLPRQHSTRQLKLTPLCFRSGTGTYIRTVLRSTRYRTVPGRRLVPEQ